MLLLLGCQQDMPLVCFPQVKRATSSKSVPGIVLKQPYREMLLDIVTHGSEQEQSVFRCKPRQKHGTARRFVTGNNLAKLVAVACTGQHDLHCPADASAAGQPLNWLSLSPAEVNVDCHDIQSWMLDT